MSNLYKIGRSYVDPNTNNNVSNVASLSSLLSKPFNPALFNPVDTNVDIENSPAPRIYNLNIARISPEYLNMLESSKLHKKMSINASKKNVATQKVDLRSKFPQPFDQGQLGSCTANALCGLMAYDIKGFIGSRLFLYYNERRIENDVSNDNGAFLSDGVKSLQIYGICPETDWVYNVAQFATVPPRKAYSDALKHRALQVRNINNDTTSMKNALNSGYPFVVGISVYASFESDSVASNGMVPMPSADEQCLGGHAVVCVGYDDSKQLWIMRNSWGSKWGDKGYFYLPYPYLLDSNLSSDLWCVTKMS